MYFKLYSSAFANLKKKSNLKKELNWHMVHWYISNSQMFSIDKCMCCIFVILLFC